MKKAIVIISAVVLLPVLFFVLFGIPYPVPDGFVVPTENVRCGESMVMTVLKKGLPDKVDTGNLDITGSVTLIYYDEEIIGMNMNCYYNYRPNNLYSICYRTDFSDFNTDDFVEKTTQFMDGKLGDDFSYSEYDEEVHSEDYCKGFDYSYNSGAVGESVWIDVYENSGDISIDFMW